MPRAILKNGTICPVEPIPSDWTEGTELQVEKAQESYAAVGRDKSAEWMREVEALAAMLDPAVDQQLEAAIADIRKQAKWHQELQTICAESDPREGARSGWEGKK